MAPIKESMWEDISPGIQAKFPIEQFPDLHFAAWGFVRAEFALRGGIETQQAARDLRYLKGRQASMENKALRVEGEILKTLGRRGENGAGLRTRLGNTAVDAALRDALGEDPASYLGKVQDYKRREAEAVEKQARIRAAGREHAADGGDGFTLDPGALREAFAALEAAKATAEQRALTPEQLAVLQTALGGFGEMKALAEFDLALEEADAAEDEARARLREVRAARQQAPPPRSSRLSFWRSASSRSQAPNAQIEKTAEAAEQAVQRALAKIEAAEGPGRAVAELAAAQAVKDRAVRQLWGLNVQRQELVDAAHEQEVAKDITLTTRYGTRIASTPESPRTKEENRREMEALVKEVVDSQLAPLPAGPGSSDSQSNDGLGV